MTVLIFSATLRFFLTVLVAYKLARWAQMLNLTERFGLGLIGGSAFMTIPVILDRYKEGTPFDVWAGLIFTMGVTLYLLGRLSRHIRHERRNLETVQHARDHFARKSS